MKKRSGISLYFLFTAFIFVLTSCSIFIGENGVNGKAYIAYSWVSGPISFYTDDPAFENQTYITNGVYNNTSPGTYYFEYISWDDSLLYFAFTFYIYDVMVGVFMSICLSGYFFIRGGCIGLLFFF